MGTNGIADWACYLFIIYMVLLTAFQCHAWAVTIDLYGRMPWREAGKTLAFKIGSLGAYQLFWPLFGISAVLFSHQLIGSVRPASLIGALAACLVYDWVYHATPASVLLLGTSRAATLSLRHRIERGIHPYRVVVLLDAAPASTLPDATDVSNRLEWDNFRTATADWRSVVHTLIDITPLVVLDARVASPAVVEEAMHILGRDDLRRKALFIGAVGAAPAIDAAVSAPDRPDVLPEPAVVDALISLGLTRTCSPDHVMR